MRKAMKDGLEGCPSLDLWLVALGGTPFPGSREFSAAPGNWSCCWKLGKQIRTTGEFAKLWNPCCSVCSALLCLNIRSLNGKWIMGNWWLTLSNHHHGLGIWRSYSVNPSNLSRDSVFHVLLIITCMQTMSFLCVSAGGCGSCQLAGYWRCWI